MMQEYSRMTVKHQNRKRYTGVPCLRPFSSWESGRK